MSFRVGSIIKRASLLISPINSCLRQCSCSWCSSAFIESGGQQKLGKSTNACESGTSGGNEDIAHEEIQIVSEIEKEKSMKIEREEAKRRRPKLTSANR
jgi:hypothetical protein